MWPTNVMEVLFTGSMVALLVDIGGRRSPPLKRYGAWFTSLAAVSVSMALLAVDWKSSLSQVMSLQPTSDPMATLYVVDRYTTFMGFTILVVVLFVTLYSVRYFEPGDRPTPFYALLLTMTCSLVGVASAGDFLTLFLFWEGMSVSGYGLVAFGRTQVSLEASMKYFIMAGIGSLLALYGIGLIYYSSGTIQLGAVATTVSPLLGTPLGQLGVALLVVGLGVEAAIVPLHTWLPDVYSGSAVPVASLMSGAVTGTGVFAIFKILQQLVPGVGTAVALSPMGLQLLLAALALVTMLVGNFSALTQPNLRRMLSFSSIAQTGYMLAALSTLSLAGLVAALFTIWNHGILKSNFFMLLGKEDSSLGSSSFASLRGKGRSDRRLGFLYASSSLGMVGAPPFGMFWSEILVVQSLILASGPTYYSIFAALAVAVVLNIVLSIGYYFRVINNVVFGESSSATKRPLADLLPSAGLLSLSLVTGLAPLLFLGNVI